MILLFFDSVVLTPRASVEAVGKYLLSAPTRKFANKSVRQVLFQLREEWKGQIVHGCWKEHSFE